MVIHTKPDPYHRLLEFFPESTHSLMTGYLELYPCNIKVTSPRLLKLGSFRAAGQGRLPTVSINNDLGKYSFLLVFVHELAHYHVWKNHHRRAKPHGEEWKKSFFQLMQPYLDEKYLPAELIFSLLDYFRTTPSSFHRNRQLLDILNKLEGKEKIITLADIKTNDSFRLLNGKKMIKLEKMRTRYKCYCPENRRYYLVSPNAQIIP